MEDRKTALAVFLCIIVVLFYSEMFLKPPAPPVPTTSAQPEAQPFNESRPSGTDQQSTPPANSTTQTTSSPKSAFPSSTTGDQLTPPDQSQLEEGGAITVESSRSKLRISLLGGRLLNAELKDHKKTLEGNELLDLVRTGEGGPYPLGVEVAGATDLHTIYSVARASTAQTAEQSYRVPQNGDLTITLEGTLSDGRPVQKIFTIQDTTYLFALEISTAGEGAQNVPIWLDWSLYIPDAANASSYDPLGFMYLSEENDVETVAASEVLEAPADPGNAKWVALGDKYFMGALLASQGTAKIKLLAGKQVDVFTSRMRAVGQPAEFKVFVGPREYGPLFKLGNELHRSVDMGIWSFLAHPLMQMLHLFYSILGNYGLAIILLTLLVKLAFLPLTVVSFRSMKAMQDLQPEIKALREQIKDPTQLNQEMMGLYKKRGVNPMGGCFPMLIQIPVFLGLYMGLMNTLELRHAPFALWVTDLSAPEALIMFGIKVPVMILLMGISMILQQWYTPSAMDPQQKKAMMMVPFIFTIMFIVFPFPAGLVLYWLVNNVISIIQQGYLRSERNVSPLQATCIASVGILFFGYIITLV